MFLSDLAEFRRARKVKNPTNYTSYLETSPISSLPTSQGKNGFPVVLRGNYYYDTDKGSRTGLTVNNKRKSYNLPRIESQNNLDTVYGGLGNNKYLKQLNKQTRPIRTVRKRGDKTFQNTRKATQTINISPKETTTSTSNTSTYTPRKLSEVNTTPKPTQNTSVSAPKQPVKNTPNTSAKSTSSPKQNVKTPTSTSVKKSSKFLNKYTLGAVGILGAGAVGYGGYKLLTRNKNKKDK